MDESQQRAVCNQHGAEFLPPVPGSRVGIAIETLGLQPLNGLRIDPGSGVCGWFLWAGGEPSDAEDFYKRMCIEHVADYCPAAISFLALPPGWRFLTDGNHVDVWFDATLTEDRRSKR
jgi:hypothetical protein